MGRLRAAHGRRPRRRPGRVLRARGFAPAPHEPVDDRVAQRHDDGLGWPHPRRPRPARPRARHVRHGARRDVHARLRARGPPGGSHVRRGPRGPPGGGRRRASLIRRRPSDNGPRGPGDVVDARPPNHQIETAKYGGRPDAGTQRGMDGGAEEGVDPALAARAAVRGAEVRLPAHQGDPRALRGLLRPQRGDVVPGAAAARGAGLRPERVGRAGGGGPAEVLHGHRPRPDRAREGEEGVAEHGGQLGPHPPEVPMTAVDAYLAQVSRGMAGMDPTVRADVVMELRSHLRDASAEAGDERAVAAAEPPKLVARRYKQLYGYGRAYQASFVLIGAALAVPTLPILLYSDVVPWIASLVAVPPFAALIADLLWGAGTPGLAVRLVA